MTEAVFEKKKICEYFEFSVEDPTTQLTRVDLVSLSGSRFMTHTAAHH